MQNKSADLIIWLNSSSDKFKISTAEAESLRIEYSDSWNILCLPQPRSDEEYGRANAFETVTINVVVFATLAFVFSKFVEGFIKDAGSDFYKFLKKKATRTIANCAPKSSMLEIVTELASRNESLSYSAHQDIRVFCRIGDDNVCIMFNILQRDYEKIPGYQEIKSGFYSSLEKINKLENPRERYDELTGQFADSLKPMTDYLVNEQLSTLLDCWPEIMSDIERHKIGSNPALAKSGFHIIRQSRGKKWMISGMSAHETDLGIPLRF